MSTTTTKSYEIAIRVTERLPDRGCFSDAIKTTNEYIPLAELMDLIDDEQARQIKEAIDAD